MGTFGKLAFLAVIFFGVGIAAWKLTGGSFRTDQASESGPSEAPSPDENAPMGAGIVEVEGEPITRKDVEFEFQLHTLGTKDSDDLTPIPTPVGRLSDSTAALKERLLSSLVERRVLFKFVQKDKAFPELWSTEQENCEDQWRRTIDSGLSLFSDEENRRRLKSRICESSVLTRYLREVVYQSVSVSDEEVLAYFKEHQQEFKGPERVEIRQIVLPTIAEAQGLHRRLNRDNFADMARQYSITPEGKKGGLIGPFTKGQLPAVFDIAFIMKVGEISPVQESSYGHHIMMVTRKFKKDDLELDEVRDKIRLQLVEGKEKEEYKKWVDLAIRSVRVETTRPIW